MDVTIAGAHGQVARLLTRQLTGAGHTVTGLIRDAAQKADIEADGGTPVVIDLESSDVEQLRGAVAGSEAVVFAAGAGAGSGAERKWTVDHGAAVLLLRAAEAAGTNRYVMLSSMGAGSPPAEQPDEDVFATYLRAKAAADREVMDADIGWTIVRPGGLTDDAGTGHVTLDSSVDRGQIAREDVAAVLRACLEDVRTVGSVFEVVSGDTAITTAVGLAVTG